MLVGTGAVFRTAQCPWRRRKDRMKEEQMSESGYKQMRLTRGYKGIKGKVELLEVPWEAN